MSATAVASKPFLAPIGGNFSRPLSSAYRMPRLRATGTPIWQALGLPQRYWEQALTNAQYFSPSHLKAQDEVDERRLDAALHKAWGADYEANYDASLDYLQRSGKQFWHARDDEGHAFKNMPMMWEAALAASNRAQPSLQP